MPRLRVDGELLYFEDRGELGKGATFFMLHGAAGCSEQWAEVTDDLAREHRVIALDLPGHGISTGQGCRSVEAYLATVANFIKMLNLPPFIFCGHSMGSAIALDYALRFPDDLMGLALLSAGARLKVSPHFLEICLEDDLDKLKVLLTKLAFSPTVSLVQIQKWQKKWGIPSSQVRYGDFLACDNFDRLDTVADINIPTLLLCGDEDRMTPLKYSEFLCRALPNASLKVIESGGHMVIVEKPGDVSEILSAFAMERIEGVAE